MEKETPQTEETIDKVAENNFVIESAGDQKIAMGLEEEKQESIEENPDAEEAIQKEEAKDTEKPKRKSRAQRKIESQNRENAALKAELDELKASKPAKVEEAKEINIDDFENYDDYIVALEKQSEEPKKPKEEVSKETAEEVVLDPRIAELREYGNEDYENFDELVNAEDLAITEQLLDSVLDSDSPHDVMYYLATHKDQTKDISKMSKRAQEREIIKIEMAIDSKEVKPVKTSKAPEPINPLDGGSTEIKTPETATNFNDYSKVRSQQQKQKW